MFSHRSLTVTYHMGKQTNKANNKAFSMIGRIFILSFFAPVQYQQLAYQNLSTFLHFFRHIFGFEKENHYQHFSTHRSHAVINHHQVAIYSLFFLDFFFLKMNRRWVVSTRFFFLSHLNENCHVGIFGACPAVYSTLCNASHKIGEYV